MSTANAIDTVSKTSSIAEGSGTIIIAKIAITKITTLKSFFPSKKFKVVPICCLVVSFFANFYSNISAKVKSAKKESILPCNLFRNGHNEHRGALPDGQEYIEGAQSKTAGAFPSTDDITSSIFIFLGSNASAKPPFTPLYDFKIPCFAIAWRIFAKKLFGIES